MNVRNGQKTGTHLFGYTRTWSQKMKIEKTFEQREATNER